MQSEVPIISYIQESENISYFFALYSTTNSENSESKKSTNGSKCSDKKIVTIQRAAANQAAARQVNLWVVKRHFKKTQNVL